MGQEPQLTTRSGDWLARRPAVPAAVAFLLGITLREHLPLSPTSTLIGIATCAIAALLLWRCERVCSIALGIGLVLAGAMLARMQLHFVPADEIGLFTSEQSRLAEIEVTITTPPRVLTGIATPTRAPAPRQIMRGEARSIRTTSGWRPASGEILIQVDECDPQLKAGQTLRVIGALQRPLPAGNPGQFNWAEHYRRQRILASLRITYPANIRVVHTRQFTPLISLRLKVRELLGRGFAPASIDHSLLRALLVGDSDEHLRDIQADFQRTGTSHHLSISGMHIAILGGFVYLVCRALRCRPRLAAWIGMVFVVLYGTVALPSPPVVRSVLLCLAVGLGIVQRRSIDMVQLLAVSVLAMLVYHPLDLLSPGFQLSFGTVLGLLLFTRPLVDWWESWAIDEHERVARRMQPPRGLRAARIWLAHALRESIAAGLVAWTVSLPLIAFHFSQLNPWAILASLALAVPVLLALVAGLLKVVLSLLIPWFAPVWAAVAALPVAAMRHLVDWLATWPGSDFPIPSPPIWLIVIYYGLLILPLLPVWQARWRRLGPVCALTIVPLAPLLALGGEEARITVLSVGAGSSVVIGMPDGRTAMVDCGSSTLTEPYRTVVDPFLRHQCIRVIDSLFLTHCDADHYSGVEAMARAGRLKTVYVGPRFSEGSPPSARQLLLLLGQLGIEVRTVREGDAISFGAAHVAIVWTGERINAMDNDASLVMRFNFAERSMLLTGDIETPAERALLSYPENIASDVLLAPHHGSAENATAAFISAVNPSLIVCSDDRTPSQKQRLFPQACGGRPVYHTRDCGAIVAIFDETGLRTETQLPLQESSP